MPIQTAIDSISQNQGSPFGFKNRIINGGMVIDQRNAGASVTPSNGQYTVDRWFALISQSSKFTVQQNAGSVTPPSGFLNYLGCTSSSAYSVGSSEYFIMYQYIEGLNMADLAWGTSSALPITLSFWVRSSLTGTFGGSIANSDSSRSYPFTYTINQANTWEKETIIIPGDTTGTWLTNNLVGIKVGLSLGAGSSASGTSGSWAGSNFRSATGAVSVVGTNAATFYFTGVQVEVGRQASSFDFRSYTNEFQLCQRYYTRFNTFTLEAYQGATGYNRALNTIVPLPVEMRTTPTRTVITTGSSSNIRPSVTDYSGLNPVSSKHLNAFLETNNSTGTSSISGRTEAFDAEL